MARLAAMMMACDEATFLVSKSRDQKLSFKERINLRMHLLSCKICLRFARDIEKLDNYLKSDAFQCTHHNLNAKKKEEIKEIIIKEIN